MTLKIKIEGQQCMMTLLDGKKNLGEEVFAFDRSLGEELIVKLDKIFGRSKIDKTLLKDVKFVGEIDKNTTNFKLLQAFRKGLLSTN